MADKRHSWINFPTISKRKCTKCECLKDIIYINGKKISRFQKGRETYYDKVPECVTNQITEI